MAAGMVILAVLLLFSMHEFGGGTATTGPSASPSILSRSPAENQIKLCAEGRASSYGNPPSPAQQGKCVRELAGEIAGGGSLVSGGP
jgi:hypothetical protein